MLKWEFEGGQNIVQRTYCTLGRQATRHATHIHIMHLSLTLFIMSLWFSGVLAWHNVYPLTVILITMQWVDVLGMFYFLFLFVDLTKYSIFEVLKKETNNLNAWQHNVCTFDSDAFYPDTSYLFYKLSKGSGTINKDAVRWIRRMSK